MHQNINNNTGLYQSFKITTELQRALQILSMPTEDLFEFVQKEIASNPLYELPSRFSQTSSLINDTPIPHQESIFENLLHQALLVLDKNEIETAKLLLGSLNPKGFLDVSLEELSREEHVDIEALKEVQKKIVKLSPLGIGSKNPREYFLLQLEEKEKENSLCYKLVNLHYNALIHQRYSEIQKKEKISKKMIQNEVEKHLKPLKLHPLQPLCIPRFARADIVVQEGEKGLNILIDDEEVYPINVTSKYQKLFTANTLSSPEKKCLIKALSSGNWLIKNLKIRKETLYKITKILLEKQKDFFLEGKKIEPITINQVAQQINLCTSTISRCIQNKYIKTPFGLFPLKHFFIHQYKTNQPEIHKELKKLIDNEEKTKPLTDEQICEKLSASGIKVSRRCVSKYRNSLNILSSKKRQKY